MIYVAGDSLLFTIGGNNIACYICYKEYHQEKLKVLHFLLNSSYSIGTL